MKNNITIINKNLKQNFEVNNKLTYDVQSGDLIRIEAFFDEIETTIINKSDLLITFPDGTTLILKNAIELINENDMYVNKSEEDHSLIIDNLKTKLDFYSENSSFLVEDIDSLYSIINGTQAGGFPEQVNSFTSLEKISDIKVKSLQKNNIEEEVEKQVSLEDENSSSLSLSELDTAINVIISEPSAPVIKRLDSSGAINGEFDTSSETLVLQVKDATGSLKSEDEVNVSGAKWSYTLPATLITGDTITMIASNEAGAASSTEYKITKGILNKHTTITESGDDTIFALGGNNKNTKAGDGDDFIIDTGSSNKDNDRLYGEEGDDTIIDGKGNDKLYGGSGNDTLVGTIGNNLLKGGEGDDTIIAGVGADKLYGDAGNDELTDGVGNNTLKGGDGNDILNSSSGKDLLYGEAGDDTLYDGAGNDKLYGGAGDDTLHGGAGNDRLYGGDGKDSLYDGIGNDFLYGEDGADVIYDGAGNDRLYGQDGDDTLYDGLGNDKLYGGNGNDTIVSGAGNDILDGGKGDDTFKINSGNGYDIVNGNKGTDSIIGSSSDDTMGIRAISGIEHIDGKEGINKIEVENGRSINLTNTTIENIDEIIAGSGNNTIKGSNISDDNISGGTGNNKLYGNAGDDTLSGKEGNDVLYGGEGTDTLLGGDGNDRLYGQNGNDTITGNEGVDKIYAGSGNDTIHIDSSDTYVDGGSGYDTLITEQISIDLNDLKAQKVKNIEALDLTSDDYILDINSEKDIKGITDSNNTLKIEGQNSDEVKLDKEAWTKTTDDSGYDLWSKNGAKLYIDEDIIITDL